MLMTISADATLKNWIYYHLHYLRLADWHIEFNQTVIKINKILLKIEILRSRLENKIGLKLRVNFLTHKNINNLSAFSNTYRKF